MKNLCYFLLLFIFSACDNKTTTIDPSIHISEDSIVVDYFATTKKVIVESNCIWDISETPLWCIVENKIENNKQYLEITISQNNSFQERESSIVLTGDNITKRLFITQTGIKKSSSLNWHTFPVNSISSVTFKLGSDNNERNYQLIGSEIFINSSIRSKIFHGNLINSETECIKELIDYKNYTYNPITISSFVNGQVYCKDAIIPSLENTINLASEILTNNPGQNLQFSYQDTPIQYNSYKHLHLLGMGNLGINLDEVISGKSYLEREMGNHTGMIYSYCNKLFRISMDIPRNLIKGTISESDLKNLSYINSIDYGETAFLIIETDYHYDLSRLVVSKIMKGEQLSDSEEKIKKTLKAYYLYFDINSNIQVKKGGEEVIEMYIKNINNHPTIPLCFTLGKYVNNSVNNFSFKLRLP